MKFKRNRGTIRYSTIAVLLFTCMLLAAARNLRERKETNQVQIVFFGDSVFGLIRDETAAPALLQELAGKTVYNAALGGTSAARMGREARMDTPKDSFSLVGLCQAVYARDFGVQRSLRIRESNTECYPEVIAGLAAVDFSGVETVVILQGINDYHAGIPIENPEDPYDTYTFLGALRASLYALRKANPDVRILLMTPTYAWYIASGETCEETDNGGGILTDYVEAEIRAAEDMEVELIDVFHDFYPHESWEDWERYTFDGIHPNLEGRKMLARRIAAALAGEAWEEGM